MTRKRMVGPRSDGDFAMSIGMGGGRIRKGASVVEKKKTAKPETSMETKKKATRTKAQMSRLLRELKKKEMKDRKKRWATYTNLAEGSEMAITGTQKGGLLKEISKFKKNLIKQDKSDRIIVNAYKRLQKHKYSKEGKPVKKKAIVKSKDRAKWVIKKEFKYPLIKTSGKKQDDLTVRKVFRKNKKLVKEKFKEQIKKDRANRKLAESKKRRVRNK